MRWKNQVKRSATSRIRIRVRRSLRLSLHRLGFRSLHGWLKIRRRLGKRRYAFPLFLLSLQNRLISPIMRNCTNLLFIVNHTAHPNNMIIRMYDHNISLTPLIQLFNSSMIYNLLFGYKDTYLRSKFIEILFFYHFLVTFSKRLSSYS